jgi:uridine phosphorylase
MNQPEIDNKMWNISLENQGPKEDLAIVKPSIEINTKCDDVIPGNLSPNSSLCLRSQRSLVHTRNENLETMDQDFLYHLGLTKENAKAFSTVKYVCIGGTNDRMSNFAEAVGSKFGYEVKSVGMHKRYVLYHVGPCLVCSHGMGGPSISILLNEIAKLLKYAEADALWIRMGTCGGIGVPPGTVCVSSQSLNGALEPFHETIVLGKKVRRTAIFDEGVAKEFETIC